MRILVISFYFPPDLCAGSFRAGALVDALAEKLEENDVIDVITTFPNRYATYSMDALARETRGIARITRISVPSHHSGKFDQSLAFAQFAAHVWREVVSKQYDLIFATTSRLITGFLGAVIARRLDVPLYLDIRDIFTDTMKCLLSGRPLSGILPFFRWMEKVTVRSASRINLVSEGFKPYFEKFADEKQKFISFPNGIDEEFIAHDFRKDAFGDPPLVLYAGNIGEGQGLHRIIPNAAKRLENKYRFMIVGDGGMRRRLEEELKKNNIENVQILDPVPRSKLLELYTQADYLFLHLNDYDAFRKVLPSKVFEYAATGKPILAGVSGYPRAFIVENVKNASVFDPCDSEGLIEALKRLSSGMVDRSEFIERFRRETIMQRFAEDILRIARTSPKISISSSLSK